ncbi:MAG TPA: hypothetical protein VNN22_00735 [Verrucomicrobiae bacterium]|nr:hypothetical protein [Verrucomicrobiae bacterium]
MSATTRRFIRADDLTHEQGWRLIDWCAERGGDEFSVQFMCLDGERPTSHGQLRSALAPFHRGTPKRERVTTMAGEESRRPTDTWGLCADSAAHLRRHVSDGIFLSPSYAAAGWFEDFIIYRHGEIMLGVVNHEGLVVLCLSEQEHHELSNLKIESYETARRVSASD